MEIMNWEASIGLLVSIFILYSFPVCAPVLFFFFLIFKLCYLAEGTLNPLKAT